MTKTVTRRERQGERERGGGRERERQGKRERQGEREREVGEWGRTKSASETFGWRALIKTQ